MRARSYSQMKCISPKEMCFSKRDVLLQRVICFGKICKALSQRYRKKKKDSLSTHCNTLHHTATRCDTLHHAATRYHALQHTATQCNTRQHTATHDDTLQQIATHGNTRQHTAAHCNALPRTATHCNALPYLQQRAPPRRERALVCVCARVYFLFARGGVSR